MKAPKRVTTAMDPNNLVIKERPAESGGLSSLQKLLRHHRIVPQWNMQPKTEHNPTGADSMHHDFYSGMYESFSDLRVAGAVRHPECMSAARAFASRCANATASDRPFPTSRRGGGAATDCPFPTTLRGGVVGRS